MKEDLWPTGKELLVDGHISKKKVFDFIALKICGDVLNIGGDLHALRH